MLAVKTHHLIQNVFTPQQCASLHWRVGAVDHHQDEEGHATYDATQRTRMPALASSLYDAICHLDFGERVLLGVDPLVKCYALGEGNGEVPEHVDDDYPGPDGCTATHSLLLYLNENYEGGATTFEGVPEPHPPLGSLLVFPHHLRHAGLPVTRGTKLVIKADAFTEAHR